ncbi:alanine racemase [Sphingomonas kaistensis]|uniref:alanine racemase n=1 Tax=Sphingomonas kaistensis TaxID=298708 RepID=A0A7X5YAN6_9SPHN|nr:alanine racemase [Sphingomonas kaistensis]NJC06925.1 alanine racemase [Sphingomonas kaistensis]
MHFPLALRHCKSALAANYHHLRVRSGTCAGAAIKADAYGLGIETVARLLLTEGCRDFFVSTWTEAAKLDFLEPGTLSVLHGFGPDDEPRSGVRPVLISPTQIARWKASAWASEPCDVMVDTGMNRLGLALDELGCLEGLSIHTLHSHLACADEQHQLNQVQLDRFRAIRSAVTADRYSLANSAGIYLGRDFAFDLVRPGLALYGGIPCPAAAAEIKQVCIPSAQIIQLRQVVAGESVGYNATFTAARETRVAVINIGYADGYRRAFSSVGHATFEDCDLPVIGRVSMDLVTLDASASPQLREGDWVDLDFDLQRAAAQTGISQYELLTGLGQRFQRSWT